jgi:hypothetical protein
MADRDARLQDQLDEDSQRLLRSIDEIRRLEREKRKEPMSTPRFHELARQVEQESKAVFEHSIVERKAGDDLSEPQGVTIDDVARGDGDGSRGKGESSRGKGERSPGTGDGSAHEGNGTH